MRQSKKIHGPEVRLSSKLFFAKVKALSTEDGGCWIWNGYCTTNGVPVVSFAGKRDPVRRMILLANGRKLKSGQSASTSCDNMACVNPEHVKVMTVSERTKRSMKSVNQKIKGYRLFKTVEARLAKLTEDQVKEIKQSSDTHTALAKVYPVSIEQIRRIRAGQAWAHVKTWGMM